MKDGRTHLAHKAEHAVDLDTGALVAVTLQGADVGDTTSLVATARRRRANRWRRAVASATPAALAEIVADRGYHSNQTLIDLATRSACAPTSPSPIAAAGTGRKAPEAQARSTAIAGASRRRARAAADAAPRGVRRALVRARL